MKELLTQYAGYNIWANGRIIEALLKLSPAQVDEAIISSFPSIRKAVYHTWAAEYMWLQRLQRADAPVWVAGSFAGTFQEACEAWASTSAALADFAPGLQDDAAIKEELPYNDLRGNPHATPVYDMLQHVFNHSTYHRGQMVTMLRQLGVADIPGTDFIGYARMK